MYNLVKRQAEVEILPLALSEQVGVISYSPLGDPIYHEIAERFSSHAKEHHVHPATLGVAWVISHPAVIAAIIGSRNVEQLESSLAALKVEMTPEWRSQISALSIQPPPATDRSEERAQDGPVSRFVNTNNSEEPSCHEGTKTQSL